jgi:CRISPR/Cas system-associated exonuclease Cas4 (RecB family)
MQQVSKRALIESRNLTVGDTSVVLAAVKKHIMSQALEPDPQREQYFLHPSDMAKADWCWRADYYRMTGAPYDTRASNPSWRMENVYEEGHEIHRKWQRWFWEMGILYGVFECMHCERRWWDRSPRTCFYCDSPDFLRYREIPLEAPHLHIGGHSDGGLMIEGEPFRLLEIKSIGVNSLRFEAPELFDRYQNNESLDKIWMEINRPFPSHIRQGALYLYMATRGWAEVPFPAEIVFIYEWKPNQDAKEFVIRYSARLVERQLYGAQLVTDALEREQAPVRPPWAKDEDSKICKSCIYRDHCWRLLGLQHGHESHAAAVPIKRTTAAVRRRTPAFKTQHRTA